jgi:hypothetical protein
MDQKLQGASTTTAAPAPKILTPVAPPRILESVYTDEQHERMFDVVKREGPWGTIISHHFESVDEVIATISGVIPPDHGLTLDDIAGPHFRGFFAKNSVCFYPELEDVFYNSAFLAEVKSYWSAQYAKPTLMLFNICGPHNTGLAPHLDAVTFRGVRIENTPVWLQNTMGKSGLFNDYLVKMGQVITWWYRGAPGGFTYWPDGPFEPPQKLDTPIWNRGVVVQNEMMYHRGDPVGPPEDRAIEGLKNRSVFGYDEPADSWVVTTDGEVIRRYRPEQIRFLVHWSAEVYADMDEVKKVMDHTDDLTHEQVVDTLLTDMRSRGVKVDAPSDPLHDVEFIQALMHTYDVTPTTDWITEGE